MDNGDGEEDNDDDRAEDNGDGEDDGRGIMVMGMMMGLGIMVMGRKRMGRGIMVMGRMMVIGPRIMVMLTMMVTERKDRMRVGIRSRRGNVFEGGGNGDSAMAKI